MQKIELSKGLGDSIAKITKLTGIDKMTANMAKKIGVSDCGCNKRKDTLNRVFPYKK
jgi:hypothetical protein|tara:strand:- start:832 stop:1002 length:171 start_codon:yes stop_codon:yes gene_type:complete